MASPQEEIQTLQTQLDNATDYDERSVLRKKIRDLKKAAGQAVGSVRRGDAAYRRPGTGMKGPSNKTVTATSADGGLFKAPKRTPAKSPTTGTPKRDSSPAVVSAKQDAASPSTSLPSSRKSSQSVEGKDSLVRASPGRSANGMGDTHDDHPDDDRDREEEPDVEEADFAPTGEEEEKQDESDTVTPPTEQVEEPSYDKPEDEPEDRRDEPESTAVEPEGQADEQEEVEEEEIAEEPSAVQEHEPDLPEMEEEQPPEVEDSKAEAQREVEETTKVDETKPEKKESTSRRQMRAEGEVRKDKKGPEQVDFRNVLRRTGSPASAVASTKFYRSGDSEAKQDSDETGRAESPEKKDNTQALQANGAEDVDSVVAAYEARREARRKAREARRKSTDEKARETAEKMSYRERREQELKKQASQTPTEQQSAPPTRPMQRQTSSTSNPTKQLLQWAQHKTRFYDNVNVTDFTHSFKDGLALASIMHCYMPECVPIDELSTETPRKNFEVAFAAAKEAGIPEMLDADDFLTVAVPDAQSVMTYLVTVYQHFN